MPFLRASVKKKEKQKQKEKEQRNDIITGFKWNLLPVKVSTYLDQSFVIYI